MQEITKRELHTKFKNEIEEWFKYLDQVKFGRKLEKRMLTEIRRYLSGRKSIDEIVEEISEEPKWIIEIEEGLFEKYPDAFELDSILGYT